MSVFQKLATLVALMVAAAFYGVNATEPVAIQFFHQPGCPECEQVRRDVLPDLEVVFPGRYRLEHLDITKPANAARLIAVQEALGVWDNEPVSILVADRFYLAGLEIIRDQLVPAIQTALDEHSAQPQGTAIAIAGSEDFHAAIGRRVARFTVPGIMLAGLLDSLNPCAISALIFFISVLSLARIRGRRLAVAGAAFIAASYATYFLLGFGLLGVLRSLTAFTAVKSAVDTIMIMILLVLAGVSLHDAWAFRRSGRPDDVRLQLPGRIKTRIHRLAREGVRTHRLVVAALIIGSGVTVMESVCTGQVYVPALILMARTGRSLPRVVGLLGLYNLMFVMPLIAIFALVFKGLEMPALLAWSRHHVAPAKLMLAGLFIGMALLIYYL